jgi:hypothetical protein
MIEITPAHRTIATADDRSIVFFGRDTSPTRLELTRVM